MADDPNLGVDTPLSDDLGLLDDTVDTLPGESAEDDALQAHESSLDEFAADTEEPEEELDETHEQPTVESRKEKGINARIRAGVQKGIQREMANIRASLASDMQKAVEAATAPLKSQLQSYQNVAIEREAQALVDSGKVTDLEIAKAYVRQKYGASTPSVLTPEPKDTPTQQEKPAAADSHVTYLAKQAIAIKRDKGIDVGAFYKSNPAVQQKVNSGEWDMRDVAAYMQRQQKTGKIPAPVRSAGGGGIPKVSIDTMSDEQFDKMDQNIANGKVYRGSRG